MRLSDKNKRWYIVAPDSSVYCIYDFSKAQEKQLSFYPDKPLVWDRLYYPELTVKQSEILHPYLLASMKI